MVDPILTITIARVVPLARHCAAVFLIFGQRREAARAASPDLRPAITPPARLLRGRFRLTLGDVFRRQRRAGTCSAQRRTRRRSERLPSPPGIRRPADTAAGSRRRPDGAADDGKNADRLGHTAQVEWAFLVQVLPSARIPAPIGMMLGDIEEHRTARCQDDVGVGIAAGHQPRMKHRTEPTRMAGPGCGAGGSPWRSQRRGSRGCRRRARRHTSYARARSCPPKRRGSSDDDTDRNCFRMVGHGTGIQRVIEHRPALCSTPSSTLGIASNGHHQQPAEQARPEHRRQHALRHGPLRVAGFFRGMCPKHQNPVIV